MNWVKANREKLAANNYIRKADAKTNYWLDLSNGKLDYYRKLTNDKFNIIIYGDDNIETDFYIIPYQELNHLLVENNFAKSEGRKRWIGNIINHHISLSNTGVKINIAHRYSLPFWSNETLLIVDSERTNDYAIENAKREIRVRVKQSIFRKKTLENFNNQCCLTGIKEKELLVASHIIPWSSKIETRLSPHNGLCLSVLYDNLFDKGYFTINQANEVIITSKIDSLSKQTQQWLVQISGHKLASPKKYEISEESLAYHRNNIFDRFNG